MRNLYDEGTVDVIDTEASMIQDLDHDVPRVVPMVRPVLPGRYEDLGEIARGSFGEVRRVRDTLLDRVVAMKVLRAEHADVDHVRQRFLTEVRITAQLQHPGIVAVHDRGELPDGRLWFTMKEIRGRTLSDVIDELHSVSNEHTFGTTTSGWTFRRLVDAFSRIVQAVAYAHECGIVHRDLKPENLMVGEFGEVLVMDWGLARRVGLAEHHKGASFHNEQAPGLTQHGDILGTPAYMSPEQARGALALHGPASDVYALGAVLYCLLAGKPPYEGTSSRDVLMAVLTQSPTPLPQVAHVPVPDALRDICERAMRRNIAERYPNAAAMWDELVAWLDGVRLREQALAALEQARTYEPDIAELRANAHAAKTKARSIQNELRAFDPIDKKRPAWNLEDEAHRLGRAAALLETKWLEAVHGALSVDSRLPEAHLLLADHYRQQLIEAEREHRDEDAARAEELLRIHDRGNHAGFLRGDGRLTLMTDPPGAEVFLDRFVLQDRRLVPVPEGTLGKTPLREVSLPHGSYLLRLQAPGRTEVRYPVLIERDGHWDGIAPGESEPFPIYLPNADELGADEVYIPAGWSWIGGDPEAMDGLPRKRIWIDAFVLGRFPVTNAEYLAFLNDLVAKGQIDLALRSCPRKPGTAADAAEPVFLRDSVGKFLLPNDNDARLPAVLMDWHAASAYAAWVAEQSRKPWRLPNELEREKAARGVDGRLVPWGNQLEANYACVVESHRGEPLAVTVDTYPTDESLYGVRGLAGNVRDWCINVWKLEGPLVEKERLQLDAALPTDDDFRIIRGGNWGGPMQHSRSATRFGARPGMFWWGVGMRLARTIRRL